MALKLIESAQVHWPSVNESHLGLLVRADVRFERDHFSIDRHQEVIRKLSGIPIHRSPMSSTGTPSQLQHNVPTERTIQ
ncbi:hypothetical protein C6361_27450 [Plantactinospora sp. BC1]|nr:hypothetical protein C6361_27450 [Plantactinospora sp. BC1]